MCSMSSIRDTAGIFTNGWTDPSCMKFLLLTFFVAIGGYSYLYTIHTKSNGVIPYTAHGAQIPPPPLFFILYAYFRLNEGQVCPEELGKRFS